MNTAKDIESRLKDFRGISLAEVEKASLMRRKDSKYIFPVIKLPLVLNEVLTNYRVLEIEGKRAHSYQTTYYDTSDLDMYHMHHNGRVNRHKVRFRKYDSSEAVFLEVKKKDAKGVTVKNRIRANEEQAMLQSREEEFLNDYSPYTLDGIMPVMENSFMRITLVSLDQSERVTLDFQLRFSSRLEETSLEIPGIGIAEIKYGKLLSSSPFHAALRKAGIVPRRFSKYCVGMAMLNPKLKQNLFKEKVLKVRKINNMYLQQKKEERYA